MTLLRRERVMEPVPQGALQGDHSAHGDTLHPAGRSLSEMRSSHTTTLHCALSWSWRKPLHFLNFSSLARDRVCFPSLPQVLEHGVHSSQSLTNSFMSTGQVVPVHGFFVLQKRVSVKIGMFAHWLTSTFGDRERFLTPSPHGTSQSLQPFHSPTRTNITAGHARCSCKFRAALHSWVKPLLAGSSRLRDWVPPPQGRPQDDQ